MIPSVPLGRCTIPQLGIGTWRLSGEKVVPAIKEALRLGHRHIDTAEFYENEREIGQAVRDAPREELFITSKAWHSHLTIEAVLSACKGSLERLDTDYLDLYLVHYPNKDVPMHETFDALAQLHREGKVHAIGVSNFTIRHLKEAMAVSDIPIACNQVEFHPWLYQQELLDFCKAHSIALVAYAPVARGRFLDQLEHLSRKHKKTPAQICLRFLIEEGCIVIPKSSGAHLAENLAIFDFSLDEEDKAFLRSMPQQRLVDPEFAEF